MGRLTTPSRAAQYLVNVVVPNDAGAFGDNYDRAGDDSLIADVLGEQPPRLG
jgi:hypothetical protein